MRASSMAATLAATLVTAACSGTSPTDAGGYDPLPPADADPTPPLVAPVDQWTWVEVPGMVCGDGSPTGVGLKLSARPDEVVVLLNGGGACWDAQTCFELHTAASIDTPFGAAEFAAVQANLDAYPLSSRGAGNPYQNASFVFVPYCTGDLHAGHATRQYTTAGGPRTVHHVGQSNLDALWPRLRATRPAASRVLLAGISAGGYGAMLEHDRLRQAWTHPTIDVLSDSSHPIDPVPARWDAMRAAWDLDVPLASQCAACATGFGGWPAYLRQFRDPAARWALLMSTRDQTIASYFGVTQDELATRTLAIRDGMVAGSGQAAFVIAGASHVLTTANPAPTTSSGVQLGDWIRQFADHNGPWATVGP